MARSQTDLQTILSELDGVNAAWFQKPLNTQLTPPYIVYDVDDEWVTRAGNKVYADWNRYTVTVVAREPDSPIPELVRNLPYAKFNRKFISGGLHHTVYVLYF